MRNIFGIFILILNVSVATATPKEERITLVTRSCSLDAGGYFDFAEEKDPVYYAVLSERMVASGSSKWGYGASGSQTYIRKTRGKFRFEPDPTGKRQFIIKSENGSSILGFVGNDNNGEIKWGAWEPQRIKFHFCMKSVFQNMTASEADREMQWFYNHNL